jgi:hypothetical protein
MMLFFFYTKYNSWYFNYESTLVEYDEKAIKKWHWLLFTDIKLFLIKEQQ